MQGGITDIDLAKEIFKVLTRYPLVAAMKVSTDFFIAGCRAGGASKESALAVLEQNLLHAIETAKRDPAMQALGRRAFEEAWPFSGPRSDDDLRNIEHGIQSILYKTLAPVGTTVDASVIILMRLIMYQGVQVSDILDYIAQEWDAVRPVTVRAKLFQTRKTKPTLNGFY
jgi:hypothetical protein